MQRYDSPLQIVQKKKMTPEKFSKSNFEATLVIPTTCLNSNAIKVIVFPINRAAYSDYKKTHFNGEESLEKCQQ